MTLFLFLGLDVFGINLQPSSLLGVGELYDTSKNIIIYAVKYIEVYIIIEHVRINDMYSPWCFIECMTRNMFYVFVLLCLALSVSAVAVYSQYPQDVETGLAYFVGDRSFENGGPPCVSCHSIKSIQVMGGSVGPDLSNVFIKGEYTAFGGDKVRLKSYLLNPDTPTMRGIWASSPLTDTEASALALLLQYASEQVGGEEVGGPVSPIYEFLFASAAVAGLVVALFAYIFVLRRGK